MMERFIHPRTGCRIGLYPTLDNRTVFVRHMSADGVESQFHFTEEKDWKEGVNKWLKSLHPGEELGCWTPLEPE